VIDPLSFKIIATDISRKALSFARDNAKLAGVDHLIEFKACPFNKTTIPQGEGVIVMNPEYGERLGEIEKLENTYKEIGDFMKQKCNGYTGYVFTGNLDLAKKVGLRTKSRTQFYNGKIECRLLEYELY
jgi:putative N6-adenine-specific DNA methylase